MCAELPTNLWANLPTAVGDGLFKEKLGRGQVRPGLERKLLSLLPLPTDICVIHKETVENWQGEQNRMAF